jgi:predicted RNA-binding Zn-ribbon protein involved in translation (DUF1610 family)
MTNQIPPHVLESIRKYERHENVTCLQCGYSGLMGVCKVVDPPAYKFILVWALWSIIALIIFAESGGKSNMWFLISGIVGWVCAMVYSEMKRLTFHECPNCGAILTKNK